MRGAARPLRLGTEENFNRAAAALKGCGLAEDVRAAGLLTLLEPIMIALLGGVVGGIVIAMYLPIFDLISKLT